MAVITVRKVPRGVIRAAKSLAKANGRSMEQEIREILQSTTMDRKSACDQIEQAWKRQSRPTHQREVDSWIRKSRTDRP